MRINKSWWLAVATLISGASMAVAQTSLEEASRAVEVAFSSVSNTTTDRGKVLGSKVEAVALSTPCQVRFTETSTLDGAPLSIFITTINVSNLRIDSLREVPSYMKNQSADFLAKLVVFRPVSSRFPREAERFGKPLDGLSLGMCDKLSCKQSEPVYLHMVKGNDATAADLIENLHTQCTGS